MSYQTIRKILITEGVYDSERTNQVALLRALDIDVKHIAAQLKIKPKTVHGYIDYTKGPYNTNTPNKTKLRIKKCREHEHELDKIKKTSL